MKTDRTDLLRGTLDMLILKTLTLQPMHGLGLARRIHQVTEGAFEVKPGSLFPALHRMEQKGWIKGTCQRHLGRVGEQKAGQVLPADRSRA
jgi:DNA-binding PadR family transcriptional regulator